MVICVHFVGFLAALCVLAALFSSVFSVFCLLKAFWDSFRYFAAAVVKSSEIVGWVRLIGHILRLVVYVMSRYFSLASHLKFLVHRTGFFSVS